MLYQLSCIPLAEMAGIEPATIRLKVDNVCMLCRLGRESPVAGPPRLELGTSSVRTRCSTIKLWTVGASNQGTKKASLLFAGRRVVGKYETILYGVGGSLIPAFAICFRLLSHRFVFLRAGRPAGRLLH